MRRVVSGFLDQAARFEIRRRVGGGKGFGCERTHLRGRALHPRDESRNTARPRTGRVVPPQRSGAREVVWGGGDGGCGEGGGGDAALLAGEGQEPLHEHRRQVCGGGGHPRGGGFDGNDIGGGANGLGYADSGVIARGRVAGSQTHWTVRPHHTPVPREGYPLPRGGRLPGGVEGALPVLEGDAHAGGRPVHREVQRVLPPEFLGEGKAGAPGPKAGVCATAAKQ